MFAFCLFSLNKFINMSRSNSKRRKIENENRTYQERWECEYLITNNNGKLQCLVCVQVLSVPKEFNLKRHYSSPHGEKFNKYDGEQELR
jgi:hypothetical protein